jgi:hypothetical protein
MCVVMCMYVVFGSRLPFSERQTKSACSCQFQSTQELLLFLPSQYITAQSIISIPINTLPHIDDHLVLVLALPWIRSQVQYPASDLLNPILSSLSTKYFRHSHRWRPCLQQPVRALETEDAAIRLLHILVRSVTEIPCNRDPVTRAARIALHQIYLKALKPC